MFRGLFEGPGIWVVLVVVLLLFGATRLPALARSIGQSTKILKDELKNPDGTPKAADPAAPATAAPATTVAEPVAPAAAPAAAAPTKSAKSGKSGKSAKS